MALPPPPPAMLAGPLNPVEALLNSFNTNPYFIGSMMLLLNLGGRHLPTALTPEQDKFFQNPWIRRGLLFVVIFVATRNVLTAFWLSLGIILLVGYLTNETSALYLFGPPKAVAPTPPPPPGLTPEEQDFLKRLQDKASRSQPVTSETPSTTEEAASEDEILLSNYVSNMRQIQMITSASTL